MGTYVDALGRAKRPWNRNCDEDALRMAYDAIANDGMLALKSVQGPTAWSLDAFSSRNV